MRFEFDEADSLANKAKHGIDFVEAQAMWLDVDLLEIPAQSSDKSRWQIVAVIDRTTWSAFITYRHDATRIISVRRARPEERARYLAR